MTDATMLERAARAAQEAGPDSCIRGLSHHESKRIARAVLMAVRNPSNSVLLAGEATGDQYEGCDPADCWPAIIDAILADGGGQ